MFPFLFSLLPELVYKVIKDLLIENARSFLLYYYIIYNNSKYTFNKKCFRILLIRLKHYSLLITKNILKKQSYYFLKKIFI
jgi:hypothetical protein